MRSLSDIFLKTKFSIGEMALVKLSQIHKSYLLGKTRVKALQGVSLQVQCGEFLAIGGPSGSGKSTLLNLIGALDLPDRGSIEIANKKLENLRDDELSKFRVQHLGFVFQSFNLIPVLTSLENVEYPLLLARIPHTKERALQALAQVGLQDFVKHRPSELSGGQQQRVAIARALVGKPSLILADEPTANLDSETSQDIIHLMLGINAEDGVTFIFATHDSLIMHHAHRLLNLKDGKVTDLEFKNHF